MVLLALTCAIVDKAGSLFGVEIDDGAKVSELKKAIHKKKMYPFPVDELQLFPAKTEGGANDKKWLLASSEDAEKLEKGEKTALIADLTEKDHELQTENHLCFRDMHWNLKTKGLGKEWSAKSHLTLG
ncbi:Crinkler (CRN) family protein [Phytophthora cinnamomi]|uniref:Crinkler (CRN) family protein n=1 Tax=Phytophthora cinnamomi TaxID=4785 RepID=UPI00355ACCE3|nr:Crinkler (CRN) family protein [Phytophthora cinnamomi]